MSEKTSDAAQRAVAMEILGLHFSEYEDLNYHYQSKIDRTAQILLRVAQQQQALAWREAGQLIGKELASLTYSHRWFTPQPLIDKCEAKAKELEL